MEISTNRNRSCPSTIEKSDPCYTKERDDSFPSSQDIIMLCLGPKSECGKFLQNQLRISDMSYVHFMHTFCLQAAYSLQAADKISSSQLFHSQSFLKEMPKWKVKNTTTSGVRCRRKKYEKNILITTSRRDPPLWETSRTQCERVT